MRTRSVVAVLLPVSLLVAWAWWPEPALVPGPAHGVDAAAAPAPALLSPVTATADGASPIDAASLERTAAQPAPASGFVVRGRAVRAVDTPAPAVTVRARSYAGTAAVGEPTFEQTLTADGNGNFVCALPAPAAMTFLEFRGIGERVRSYPETFVLAPGDAPPPPFDLWVVPLTAVVRGLVLDPNGQPVAGARVGSSALEGARTTADGRFEVFVEAKANVRLYASAPGFVELREDVAVDVAKGEGACELRLRVANRIHGRVTDPEQRPIAGATVRTFFTIFTDGASTDADGRFVLDNLDPSLESHSLFARKEGYVEGKAEVKATAPDVEQDLVLGRGVEVRGVVAGAGGKLLPAATVFLGFSPSAYDRLDAVSGADGAFVFPCVAAGEHTLNVERTGFAGKRVKVTVPPPPSPPVVVRVELEAGHFVGGRAVGADGKPIAGVSIAPRLDGEYLDGIRSKTDADGRFRLDGLPGRGLDLEFYGKGILRKNQPIAAVDRDDLVVTLERHGRMAGTVVDGRTRKPITDFRIRFGTARLADGETTSGGYSATWVRGGTAFHDDNGVFRIDEEVQVGAVFALEASAVGYGASIDDHVVAVLDPDPTKTVIALYAGIDIDGVVRERATSLPIAGARVKAVARSRPLQPSEPNDDVGRPMATTDARGVFRLADVGVGEVSLVVSHADWLTNTHGPIRIEPAAAVPAQTIELDRGASVQVAVRDAAGAPMVAATVELIGKHMPSVQARSDAAGIARFERVMPGDYEVALVEMTGPRRLWTYRRAVQVERDDRRVELVAKDGDATLVVFVDCPEALPEGAQMMVMPRGAQPSGSAFRARGAWLQPDRTEIALLPATDLMVTVFAAGWHGTAAVTTVAGQRVEVRVMVQKDGSGRR